MNLYQEIIKARSKSKRFFGKPDSYDVAHELKNPLCGDEITVYLQKSEGVVHYEAYGCAICMCSADLLAETAESQSAEELEKLTESFLACIETEDALPESAIDAKYYDDFAAVLKVREFPSRIRCATLPWQALMHCLKGHREP